MRLVLLGPPGAGKGTQAVVLAKDLSVPHVSTGDMLREALRSASPLGLKAKATMDKGELVPDTLVTELVVDRLNRPDAHNGFILDGFPRTVEQARSLDGTLQALRAPLHFALYFKTSLAVIVMRLAGRRVCSKCGKNYHVRNFAPKREGVCDVCAGALVQRPDDREETIHNRLDVYEKQTAPLIEYYRKQDLLCEVSGDLDVGPLNTLLLDLFRSRGYLAATR